MIIERNGSGARYGFDEDALHRDLLGMVPSPRHSLNRQQPDVALVPCSYGTGAASFGGLIRLSAGMPSPRCRRQIIFRVRGRLRLSTS